jgi:hypothetical protein
MAGRSRPARTAGRAVQLQDPVHAGRGTGPERHRPAEPARPQGAAGDHRLRPHRFLVRQVDQGSGRYAKVNVAASAEANGFTAVPPQDEWKLTPARPTCTSAPTKPSTASNSTSCRRCRAKMGDTPLVADMSSHILSRQDRRVEVRRDLRRRPEEHRPGRPDLAIVREDLLDSALPICPAPSTGSAVADARLDVQHAADLRDLHRRPGVRAPEAPGRRGGDGSASISKKRACCTRRWTPTISTRTAWRPTTVRA